MKRIHVAILLCMCMSMSLFAQFPFFPMGDFPMPDSIPDFGNFPMPGSFHMPVSESKTSGVVDAAKLETNLPIVVIEANEKIVADRRVLARMRIVANDKKRLNRLNDKSFDYDGFVRIKLRGNSSLMLNQKKFSFETCDADSNAVKVALLGMAAESDWVLLSPYNDVSLLRDVFAFTLWREMGHWAPHTQMVEVVLNGEYVGVYALSESIKRSASRVDIAKLKPEDRTGRELTGGYILRIDAEDDKHATFQSKVDGVGGFPGSKVVWSCVYPKKKNLQAEQLDYIQQYIDDMEQAIQSEAFTDEEKGYRRYINVRSFIDYFIHTEFSVNADGLRRSVYFYKKKQNEDGTGGKLHAGPVWDYNLAYGLGAFNGANNIDTWIYEGADSQPCSAFWGRLLEDSAYRKAVKERYSELRKTVLSEKHINAFFDTYAALLKDAQKRHLDTYPELIDKEKNGRQPAQAQSMMPGGFPMMGMGMNVDMGNMMLGMFQAYRVSSHAEEIAKIKKWCADRLAVMDKVIGTYDGDFKLRKREPQPMMMPGFGFPGGVNFP